MSPVTFQARTKGDFSVGQRQGKENGEPLSFFSPKLEWQICRGWCPTRLKEKVGRWQASHLSIGDGLVDMESWTAHWIHTPVEGRKAPAWVAGERKVLSEKPASVSPAHSHSHTSSTVLTVLSKALTTFEKIKAIKSQELKTYLKSHLYHVALGVF